uniref:uncharacterized protein LOC122585113 n=1 Tax=Erigeron canadensis TaxID=72917 RepID=UPI001CB9A7A0|nr:uncharacterized protein LOC122585113 [Erigeron canadensis]
MVSDKIEPITLAITSKLKALSKSTQDFTNNILDNLSLSKRRHPIQILKRLQREAFSDIMKLRDRQDKVERLLSFKSSKVSPFQEASTSVRGEVELLGMLLMIDRIHEDNQDAIRRTGIKTGINSRFTFQTTIQEDDSLTAEFVASDKGQLDALSSPLSLAKVLYATNINDRCALTAAPLGAKCNDVGLTGPLVGGPPILNQHIGSGINLTVKRSNVIVSLAQFVSFMGTQIDNSRATHCLSTFGQVACQLSGSTKLLLLGLHKIPKISSDISLGPIALPIGMFRYRKSDVDALDGSFGSTALVLESNLDASTRVGGWIEMNNSGARNLHWGVSISDLPEDDFGWGLRLGGSKNWDHYEVEAFSKIMFGDKFSVHPSLVYVIDGSTQFPALTVKSSWSF